MPSFLSKLRSFKNNHMQQQQQQHPPLAEQRSLSPTIPKPATPDWTARRTFSISPKLRTFFDFEPLTPSPIKQTHSSRQTPNRPANPIPHTTTLGVLDSPQSPESGYSGVTSQVDGVESVRRVSKGRVKCIELTKVKGWEAACTGTQTVALESAGARARRVLLSTSGLVMGEGDWEKLHGGDAGLLFVGGSAKQMQDAGCGGQTMRGHDSRVEEMALPLTGTLLLKLQRAIAADAELLSCRRRTAREIATLHSYQESLRKRKEVLKSRLQELKASLPAYELDDEKIAVDKELVRVWEASIDTMDERLRSEERLEVMRDGFEGVAREAFVGFAVVLGERGSVDVVADGRERSKSEVEFEGRYRLG
ncbi:hypothetical protein Q7P36_003497 [Cladosporium allicinum]